MNIIKYLYTLGALFVALSCSSFHQQPLNEKQINQLAKSMREQPSYGPREHETVSFHYLKAQELLRKNNDKMACDHLRNLLTYKDFPLKTLVLSDSLVHCSFDSLAQEVERVELNKDSWDYPNLLKGLYYYFKKRKNAQQSLKYGLLYLPYILNHKTQTLEYKYIAQHASDIQVQEVTEKLFARFLKKPNLQQYYQVARSFEKVRNFKNSRRYYKKIIRNKQEDFKKRLKAMQRHALSFKLERDKEKFAIDLNKQAQYTYALLKKNTGNDQIRDGYFELKISYARALWTNQSIKKARTVLMRLKRVSSKNTDNIARIYWLLALMDVEKKKYVSASRFFLKASKYDIFDKELSNNIYWDTLWNYYLQRKYKQVILYSQKILSKIENEYVKDRIYFWVAKSYKAIGEKSKALTIWEALVSDKAYSYYGTISFKELGKKIPLLRYDSDIEIDQLPEQLRWLISFNLKDEKVRFIKSYTANKSLSVSEKIKFYHLSGSHSKVFRSFFAQDQHQRKSLFSKYPHLIFPMPISPILANKPSTFNNVENEIILSITRQESSFDPRARSWADAFGLMQLLPLKSKLLARKYKLSYDDFYDLYDSETNIFIGLALLKELKATFNNKFIHYVSAYNAGGTPVRNWQRSRFVDIPLRDIEMIPYKETRGYVKLVLRNFIIYKRLNAQEPFTFPALN